MYRDKKYMRYMTKKDLIDVIGNKKIPGNTTVFIDNGKNARRCLVYGSSKICRGE